ncbi:uncharacterized protein EV422DRAFT_509032 [Fimicolochytrium jonesii]|uniref:uncharacterized protein n=1 Tax=Fimicolochytrium jonesii TaxID=1396493 RepID=UPI0022FE720A|nr:uncharacterized protein EV422DRAFT_509032 [Fimicolochytrium jonesii]KAI8817458.1 hypothetical protein EV422DRAFT_509032 [Fimicolochytrium jonesii]
MEDSQAAMKRRMASLPVIKKQDLGGGKRSPAVAGGAGGGVRKVAPAFAPLPTASDIPMNTKVYNIINALREKDAPASEAEIFRLTAINVAGSAELRELLKNNPKITYHDHDGTYQYKPKYNLRSKEDLLSLLYTTRDSGGTELKELTDSWPGLLAAVHDLSASGDILVLTTKDAKPRILFHNAKEYNLTVSDEFKEYWHKVPMPKEADLARELEKAGLKSMEVYSMQKGDAGLKMRKRRVNKRVRMTNTHLEGLDLTTA